VIGTLNFPILVGIWIWNRVTLAGQEGAIKLSKNVIDRLPSSVRRITTEHESMLRKVFERAVGPEGQKIASIESPSPSPSPPPPSPGAGPFAPEASMLSKLAERGPRFGRLMGRGGADSESKKSAEAPDGGGKNKKPEEEAKSKDRTDATLEERIASIEEVSLYILL
jgi:hypothetical protein